LDARQGKQIRDWLNNARIVNSGTFNDVWAFGYNVNGAGLFVPIMSGVTVRITSAKLLNDSANYVSLSGYSQASYPFGMYLKFNQPSSGVTNGKTYLVVLTGSFS
jgi:hypothetical protein